MKKYPTQLSEGSMKNSGYCFFILFLLMIVGFSRLNCIFIIDKEDQKETEQSGVIMPMNMGNTWHYNYNSDKAGSGEVIMKVAEIKKYDDKELVKVEYSGSYY